MRLVEPLSWIYLEWCYHHYYFVSPTLNISTYLEDNHERSGEQEDSLQSNWWEKDFIKQHIVWTRCKSCCENMLQKNMFKELFNEHIWCRVFIKDILLWFVFESSCDSNRFRESWVRHCWWWLPVVKEWIFSQAVNNSLVTQGMLRARNNCWWEM